VICDFGEIVVVPFPFVDRPIVKRRPSLVLSNQPFNSENDHSILAMITTGAGSSWPSDVPLPASTESGLRHDCVMRWKLFTLPNSLILKRIGRLSAGQLRLVHKSVRGFLAPKGA